MSAPCYLLDTNILLRFLIGQPVPQAERVRSLFARAARGEVFLEVSPVILAEVFYTLLSYYGVARQEASLKLLALLRLRGVKAREEDFVISALERLQAVNVDFADAYLAATSAKEHSPVLSFDRDFDKFKDVTRVDPGTAIKASP